MLARNGTYANYNDIMSWMLARNYRTIVMIIEWYDAIQEWYDNHNDNGMSVLLDSVGNLAQT